LSAGGQINKRRDWLTIGYFDKLDNEPLNKYKINLKKKFIDVLFYI
jgi:hypothetical protein